MVRQTAGLADCLRNLSSQNRSEEELAGYVAYMKTELADMIVLVNRFCDALGLNPVEVAELGWQRDEEKRKEWQRRHPGQHWV
ncbi:hypothetical protein LCGC14_0585250 [marine sediment metagenome]|uniref:NTP pyrophosphohydrolase MazG putative catalytic core domain-containing protein n=1 Tax=marine sediment metagenome TaxID=412755 RepID=A0A0F9UNG3_9ZZZZ